MTDKPLTKGQIVTQRALASPNDLVIHVDTGRLHPFKDHPYKVQDNEDMKVLIESIKTEGIISPIIVIKSGNDYEVVSGHRRLHAAKSLNMNTVPVIVSNLNRDEAAVALVDSNLHREHILPSEKAFAYKMKMEALKRQGKHYTSDQVGPRLTAKEISDTDSASQVKRYIRLTNLIPELLDLIDEGKIALTPAVELSYLTEQQQYDLLQTIETEDRAPSLSQAQQMKRLSQEDNLNMDTIFKLMTKPKPNEQEKITFKMADLNRYFPKCKSPVQMQKMIIDLLERDWRERQHRELMRGDR
ncbi:MAG: ParB/RepB/Spo0J family partition protein [Eubacterium sp.]|nr:ParB/RepB/Spo0J family partition protein [Eubacterium sp.]